MKSFELVQSQLKTLLDLPGGNGWDDADDEDVSHV